MNLIVRVSEPVRLPARTQMVVKARFEPEVNEDTVVMIEPTHDLLGKHGVCLAKGLIPLTPGASEEQQLIMVNTTDQDLWLQRRMTVGQAVSTKDCDIHEMDVEDATQARLESVQHATAGGSRKPVDLAWNIGPNLTAEERKELLNLLHEFQDVFAADTSNE